MAAMAGDEKATIRRRAMLAAAAGGAAALAAQAATGLLPGVAQAANGDSVLVGQNNDGGLSTWVTTLDASPALGGRSSAGDGIQGESWGQLKSGIYGTNHVAGGYGVFGRNLANKNTGSLGGPDTGVQGTNDKSGTVGQLATADVGVSGTHPASGNSGYIGGPILGVQGRHDKTGNIGHLGRSDAGVFGRNDMSGTVGALGTPDNGVSGSNPGSATSGSLGGPTSGVEGTNDKAKTKGALGHPGAGVRATGTDQFPALVVDGTASFRHSGLAQVPKDKSSVRVTGLALGQIPQAGLAMLQAYRPGVAVAATAVDINAGTVTIYLTKKVTAITPVVWYLFNIPPLVPLS